MTVTRHLLAPLALALMLSFGHRPAAADEFPGESWEKVAPASLGVDADKLEEAVAYLKDHTGEKTASKSW